MATPDFTIDSVQVRVTAAYQPDYSRPVEGNYVFAYRVHIKNTGNHPARLLRRHWIITNGTGQIKEVEGEGVIGQKPTILPGESHEYTSWVQLETPIGAMEGTYLMEQPAKAPNQKALYFRAEIPRFLLVAPELAN